MQIAECGVRSLKQSCFGFVWHSEIRNPNSEFDMIFGTGIDIVNIERIEHLMDRWGDLFLSRVFTEREIDLCQQRTRPAECFAIRFAAKEAFLKAIGWGLRNGIQWIDIEVENDHMGRPLLSLHRKAKEFFETHRIQKALLTLSHERPYAVAHVLLEGRNDESSDR
jgi:holo-[acyl-carrier protein] synthase